MLDPTIPLTTQEYIEWGNPNEKDAYFYIKSYDPYSNVEKKAYPAMLVRASLNDSQVGYWEAAKWVARLRANKTDDNLILLRVNMGAGHGGASGRYDRLRDESSDYAWLLTQIAAGKYTLRAVIPSVSRGTWVGGATWTCLAAPPAQVPRLDARDDSLTTRPRHVRCSGGQECLRNLFPS
jgi:hypothetical protein